MRAGKILAPLAVLVIPNGFVFLVALSFPVGLAKSVDRDFIGGRPLLRGATSHKHGG